MRKGLLASLALVLGQSAAQAQYFPAQQPYYQPQTNQVPVWIVPQQPAPRSASVNYLPKAYFPTATMRPAALPTPATPAVPMASEPSRTEAATSDSPAAVGAPGIVVKTVSRPAPSFGPAFFFDNGPPPPHVNHGPATPVVFHRDCHESCWFDIAYQTAWMRNGPLGIPLVTTGSSVDTNPGALGEPGTVVLFGNNKIDYRMFHGLRADVGRFFDDDNHYSMEVGGFYFLPRHVTFNRSSDATGLPLLSRPVFNVAQNQENAYTISSFTTDPETGEDIIVSGKTSVDARAQIWGVEMNGRWHGYCGHRTQTELLFGFRTVRLEETLTIQDTVSPLTSTAEIDFNGLPINPGDVIVDRDGFRTDNQFY